MKKTIFLFIIFLFSFFCFSEDDKDKYRQIIINFFNEGNCIIIEEYDAKGKYYSIENKNNIEYIDIYDNCLIIHFVNPTRGIVKDRTILYIDREIKNDDESNIVIK